MNISSQIEKIPPSLGYQSGIQMMPQYGIPIQQQIQMQGQHINPQNIQNENLFRNQAFEFNANQPQQFNNNQKANIFTKQEINQKYKTERCRHFDAHQTCILGLKCHFAHGDQELRKPEDPIQQDMLNFVTKNQNQNHYQLPYGNNRGNARGRGNQYRGNPFNNMTKTRGSNNYYRSDNYHKKNEDFGNNFQKTNYDFKQNNQNTPNQKFKTIKCRHFDMHGTCNYGDKCSYAHGENELRAGNQINQYPSQPQFQQKQEGYLNQQIYQQMQSQMPFSQTQDQSTSQAIYNQKMVDPQSFQQNQFYPGFNPNLQLIPGVFQPNLQQPQILQFQTFEQVPDGSFQQVNNILQLTQLDFSIETQNRKEEAIAYLNNSLTDQALEKFNQLRDEFKIQFQITKSNLLNQF